MSQIRYARILNGVVINCEMADVDWVAPQGEYVYVDISALPDVGIGSIHNGGSDFSPPPVQDGPPPPLEN